MATVTLARHAMATRFELVLNGDNPVSLRAAGEEALQEIDRLEAQLSLFRPSSEIAHLNARAAHEWVRVTPPLFALLEHAKQLNEETSGAFDVTIAPLVRCWGFMGGTGNLPEPADLAAALENVGMPLVQLNRAEFAIRFAREGVMLDLGAIGKGYAIERAAELLRESGVDSALLHGGTSTVYGLGHPPEADSWRIEIASPLTANSRENAAGRKPGPRESGPGHPGVTAARTMPASEVEPADGLSPFATVLLRDESLSVSAVWGKFFRAGGRSYGHIIDPRTGEPASGAVLAAVILPSATETDALSTALLALGPAGHDQIVALRPGLRALVVGESGGEFCVKASGIATKSLAGQMPV